MKTRLLIIFGIILLPISIGSVYAECSEKDRDACFDSNGKFDYDAYEDSFWEPVEVQHSFAKNSTVTFEHKKEGLGLRGIFTATQKDVVTMTVPRNLVDSIHRNCDPDEIMLLAKYDKRYANTTAHEGFYQESFLADQKMNQTHRVVTLKVLPTMSFEFMGSFPLGLVDEMLDTCGAPNGYLTYYAPPKFQLEHGVTFENIKCNDGLELVAKMPSAHPKCVKPESVEKLTMRGWATTNKTIELTNPTKYMIEKNDISFEVQYSLKGATLDGIVHDIDANSIRVALDNSVGGQMVISIPRELIDAKIGKGGIDDLFFLLIDGEENMYGEKTNEIERTITIWFPKDASDIEIIGVSWT